MRKVIIDSADLDKLIADFESADPQYMTLEDHDLLERLIERRNTPYCCFLNCSNDAEFSVHGSSGHFEDVTETCALHVGLLLGTPTWLEKQNDHWVVHSISVPSTKDL